VASAGPYASLHLAQDNHASTPPLSFFTGCPTNSVKALKAHNGLHVYIVQNLTTLDLAMSELLMGLPKFKKDHVTLTTPIRGLLAYPKANI